MLGGGDQVINKRLEDISKEDIAALIAEQVRESRHIEYKESLPGNSDSEKKEFLADVSAFANASGGMIIYGIREKREEGQPTSLPEKIVGLSGINVDKEKQRLLAIVGSGVEPRIPNIQMEAVPGFDECPVIILKIPKSWCGPHMIKFQQWSRFYARTSAGKQLLDVGELRSTFALSENLTKHMDAKRIERIEKILAGDVPVDVGQKTVLVIHIFPVESFDTTNTIDVIIKEGSQRKLRPFTDGNGWSHRYNFDGFLYHNDWGYLQVFRRGYLEAVDTYCVPQRQTKEPLTYIPTLALEKQMASAIKLYMKGMGDHGIDAPVYIWVSMLNIKGYILAAKGSSTGDMYSDYPIREEHLFFPAVVLETLDQPIFPAMRPIFDALWQAGGFSRCLDYDDDGNWLRHT